MITKVLHICIDVPHNYLGIFLGDERSALFQAKVESFTAVSGMVRGITSLETLITEWGACS